MKQPDVTLKQYLNLQDKFANRSNVYNQERQKTSQK